VSGLDILHAIQAIHNAFFDLFFYLVTQLHHETFYILVLPLLLWLYDKRFTRYMVSLFLVGYWSNNVLKYYFDTGRPSPGAVRVLHPETGTGPAFPSGHSQNPLMFWGALAIQFNKRWFTTLAVAIIILIGFSRLYLGLHWPLDVLGGWAIGGLMLWGFQASQAFWSGDRMRVSTRLLCAVLIPLAMMPIALAVIPSPVPKDVWVMGGAYLGFWVGSVLEEEFVGFDPRRGTLLTHAVKVLIGIVAVFAVKEGFKLFMPEQPVWIFIRYVFVTLMATLGAPWVFHRFLAAPPAGRSIAR
jgi:membrane-associated phospholipid phosphatase